MGIREGREPQSALGRGDLEHPAARGLGEAAVEYDGRNGVELGERQTLAELQVDDLRLDDRARGVAVETMRNVRERVGLLT